MYNILARLWLKNKRNFATSAVYIFLEKIYVTGTHHLTNTLLTNIVSFAPYTFLLLSVAIYSHVCVLCSSSID